MALTTGFFLNKALSPFPFSVLALTSVYIGSLVFSQSPRERASVNGVARRAVDAAKPENRNSTHQTPAKPAPTHSIPLSSAPAHFEPADPAPAHPVKLRESNGADFERQFPDQHLRESNLGHRTADTRGTTNVGF